MVFWLVDLKEQCNFFILPVYTIQDILFIYIYYSNKEQTIWSKVAGSEWMRIVQARDGWYSLETFVQRTERGDRLIWKEVEVPVDDLDKKLLCTKNQSVRKNFAL